MHKHFFAILRSILALSVIVTLFLTACSDEVVNEQTVVSPAPVADVKPNNPLQLVWLTVDYWVEDRLTEDRLAAVNQRIHELGYDFEVAFQGINDDTYDNYQDGITKAMEDGGGDLMWTGLGDGDNPDAEGSYYRQIRLGNLLALDDWLQTDMGRTLKDKYSPLEWERITYKNQIYGVRNIKEQGAFCGLLLTGEQMRGENSGLKGKTDITLDELCQWLEEYSRDPEHKFYLDWKYLDDDNDASFAEIGYIKLCDGVYVTPGGKVENVWENEQVCRLWTCLARMGRKGQLTYDDSDGLDKVYSGQYPAAFVGQVSENMDGSYRYQEDGNRVPVESYVVAAPLLDHIENDVHGVTSWSKHPEEAMQLLTLVNTDEELANLLCFGEEGVNYELREDGRVNSGVCPDTYCPANPKITYCCMSEVNPDEGKEEYYKKANERYRLSPADGFVPNLEKAGADADVLKSVEFFYKDLIGADNPEQMIRDFQKELREKKYGKMLEKIQEQYDKGSVK